MTTVALSTLAGRVAGSVPGAPHAMIIHYLRVMAIDFCKKTLFWRADSTVTLTTAQFPYTVVEPTDAAVTKIAAVIADGKHPPLELIDVREASLRSDNWKTQTGTLEACLEYPRGVLTLVPLPEISTSLEITTAFEPDENADNIPDILYAEHRETLISGAIYRLAELPGKPWSNADIAVYHRSIYDKATSDAALDLNLNIALPVRRVSPPPL